MFDSDTLGTLRAVGLVLWGIAFALTIARLVIRRMHGYTRAYDAVRWTVIGICAVNFILSLGFALTTNSPTDMMSAKIAFILTLLHLVV